jgi:hypothetical protein
MANYSEEREITRLADGSTDLSAKRYYIVKQQTDRTLVLASAATDELFGVINKPAAAGGEVSVVGRNADGTFKVAAGASFSAQAYLTADSTGRAIGTTNSGDQLIGIAQEAATAAGQIVEYMPIGRAKY